MIRTYEDCKKLSQCENCPYPCPNPADCITCENRCPCCSGYGTECDVCPQKEECISYLLHSH